MSCPMHGAAGADETAHRLDQIVTDEGAQLDFSSDMSYGDYLQLDHLLSAPKPLSPDHNELLFIVQHHTSELWMKLMLHELEAAVKAVASGELPSAFEMLARVSKLWRFRHVTTVERVIGFKRGTGGVSYLRKMLDVVLFPEIWSLRTNL